ncbi:MAG: HAD family hydrolase [Bacteroidota bacterium]
MINFFIKGIGLFTFAPYESKRVLFEFDFIITKSIPLSQFIPKFIFFDLDDTLLNHKKAEQNGLADVHQHFPEVQSVPLAHLKETYHQINKGLWEEYGRGEIDRHILHRMRFEETFLALGIMPSLYEEAGKVYMNYYRNHWEWIDGAEATYKRIAEQFPVGIITNGFAETQQMKIDQFGFAESARHIVISEEIGVMKPHPKIFDHATALAGVEREEILYVGDSYTSDVVGGLNAGWKVAWLTSQRPTHQNGQAATWVMEDLKELPDLLQIPA